jgi:uncharacterized protein HemY
MIHHPGWLLVLLGVILVAAGLVWIFAPSIPWLGRLPGDLVIERGNTRIYIPITTCIVLSILLTAVLWVIRYFSR